MVSIKRGSMLFLKVLPLALLPTIFSLIRGQTISFTLLSVALIILWLLSVFLVAIGFYDWFRKIIVQHITK
ncbi:hypothetical protein ACNAN0_00055 [Agrilactobacillus fermenti]|nr:hypothetical protein [Agrilactobacillus fermenti]